MIKSRNFKLWWYFTDIIGIWGRMHPIKPEDKIAFELNRARHNHLDASNNVTAVCTLFAISLSKNLLVNLCSWASWLIVRVLSKFSVRHFPLFISSFAYGSDSGCWNQHERAWRMWVWNLQINPYQASRGTYELEDLLKSWRRFRGIFFKYSVNILFTVSTRLQRTLKF